MPGALSPGLKRPGREAVHSSPSSVEVKNVCSYTSTPPYVVKALCLVKQRDNFTVDLLYFTLLQFTCMPGACGFALCGREASSVVAGERKLWMSGNRKLRKFDIIEMYREWKST
jgi:hypothetical protein